MGISGLTTYILRNSDQYLQPIELHDTYLVIDGSCIGSQLYNENDFQCAFGGEYDMYSKCVETFFDDLLKCQITPIVLLDGGSENKKLETLVKRAYERTKLAIDPSKLLRHPSAQNDWKPNITPPFLKEAFRETIIKMKIKHIQTVFEADNTTATVAKMLKCPILSFDSDFFIFGIPYIPFSKLENGKYPASRGNGWVKRCYIYEIEKFVRNFDGLNESILPMAAILLGNDYVNANRFHKFYFERIAPSSSGPSKFSYSKRHVRIDKTLRWLCGKTIDTVIDDILSMVSVKEQDEILNAIEATLKDYTYTPTDILLKLDFDEEFVRNANQSLNKGSYQFDRKKKPVPAVSVPVPELLEEELTGINTDVIAAIREAKLASKEAIVGDLPDWFLDDLSKGLASSYFLDILVRRFYVSSSPPQNPEFRPPNLVNLNIIRMLYSLLVWGYKREPEYLNYIGKAENFGLKRLKLELIDLEGKFNCKIPNLHGLRQLPVAMRLRIMNDTLLINDERIIQELPEKWQLYIAVITYWAQEQEESIASTHHIHCLLFSLLFNIIDNAIGYYRSIERCKEKYQQRVHAIQQKRQTNPPQSNNYSIEISVKEAYENVDREDCLLIAPFFINHFQVNPVIFSDPKRLSRTILHAFSQVQSCLKHSFNLNQLLGNPYPKPLISETYNGVFLYNLYTDFSDRRDIEDYINYILCNAPSLLRLYKVLLNKVRPLFSALFPKSCELYSN